MDRFFVLSKGVLGLRTSGEDLKWSFGVNVPSTTADEYNDCAVRIRLKVAGAPAADPSSTSSATQLGKYHYFNGEPGKDKVTYRRPFMFGTELHLEAKGLLTDEPEITVNRNYFRYITHRIMNLHSVGYILTDLACLLLLRHGFSPLHCSGFRKGAAAAVIFAPPNTGKTLTAMMACIEHGADFLAEDLAVTDGRDIYSVPWTSTFRYYSRVESSRFSKMMNSATEIFPPLEMVPMRKAKPIGDYVAEAQLVDRAAITHLVILERGPAGIYEASPDEAYRKILNLNRYEFNYVKSPLIVAYEFFNPALDIDGAVEAERTILKDMIAKARKCLVVRCEDPTQYAPMILQELRG